MHLLLSGATGYLGRHALARWLRDGHRVTALVRGGDRARLLAALAPFALPPGSTGAARLQVLDCDLATSTDAAMRELRRDETPAAFVHAAGLTRFDAHLADELHTQNLRGTQHAWGLAQSLGIPTFHHLSTAYVAGRVRSPFGAADLDLGQSFNNPYEASKFAAERWLRGAAAQCATSLVVHRPSIVVGGYPIGADQSVSTLYTFMKAVQFLRAYALRDGVRGAAAARRRGHDEGACHIDVRVAADPDSTVNLVAIDDVVDALDEVVTAEDRERGSRTYALTGHDYRIRDIECAITSTMQVTGVRLVDAAAFEARPRTALEAQFHRITRVYAPYLFASPRFPPRPSARLIDPAVLTREYLAQDADRRATRRREEKAPRLAGLALDALGITDARDYFAALCAGAVGRDFLARHAYVDATVGFRLRGTAPCEVTLHFDRGRVSWAEHRAVDCRYELEGALFMRIVHGETDLRAAFLAGQVRITGNVELALKFGALLGFYYGRLDEHLVAELSA